MLGVWHRTEPFQQEKKQKNEKEIKLIESSFNIVL